MPWDFWVIFLLLAVLLPWRGRMRMQKMLASPSLSSRERILLYGSTILFQWFAVAVVGWRCEARGLTLNDLGLAVHGGLQTLLGTVLGTAILAAFQGFNLRRLGKTPGKTRDFMQKLAQRIFPRSRLELSIYLILALTAGLCEEFLYRGFAIAALRRAGFSMSLVVFISSVLFGLAHLYQGRGGFVGTTLIGVIFGIARIAYDGLAPAMAWHFAIDAIAGVVGPRYLVETNPPEKDLGAATVAGE